MSLSIGELIGTVSLNDQFSGPIKGVGNAVTGMSQSFAAVTGFATLAAGAVVTATGAIVALGMHGAEVKDVRDAFDQLSVAGGGSEKMLQALRSGTLGTISDFDLMSKSTGLLSSGMIRTAGDMQTLAAGAKMVADRTGGDTAEAFDKLSGAMASGRTNSLKALGVFVDTDGAVKKYADSLGRSVKSLSDSEVAQAKSAATLAVLKGQLDAAGPASADFGDNIAKAKVFVQNLTDNLAVSIAQSPVIRAGMEAVGASLQAAFGGTQQDTVKTLMKFINEFAIGLTYVAQAGVAAAGVFVTAFSAIQTVVLGVITAVSAVATILVAFVSGLADMGAKIPGIGKAVEGFAAGAGALKTQMEAVTTSFADQTKAAAQGVMGNSALHQTLDQVGGVIMTVRDKMEGARGAQELLTVAQKEGKGAAEEMGVAAGLSAEQIAKIEEAARSAAIAQFQAGEEMRVAYVKLQDDLTLANLTGLELRLAEIEIARQREIEGLGIFAETSLAKYEEMVAMVNEKYGLMTEAARAAGTSITEQFNAAGFQTRAQLEETANRAIATYEMMKASGVAMSADLQKAWETAEEAKRKASGDTKDFQMSSNQALVTGATQLFGALGEKFKVAAIAGAIISTYAAVAKALASAPWPASLVLAAGALAAGMANVGKIRSSQSGFESGTGMEFVDFGAGTTATLHGKEAVVNQEQGQTLADMFGNALQSQDSRVVDALRDNTAQLRNMRDDTARDRRLLPILLGDVLVKARA